MSAPAGTPNGLDALYALPDGAMVPAGWVRGLVEDTARQRTTEAVVREETVAMYCEMATRHLTDAAGAPDETA